MAGKRQKPYALLQDKRPGRRRPDLVLVPDLPPDEADRWLSEREATIALAASHIARQFGRGRRREGPETPQKPRKRRYRPRGERKPCEKKKAAAARRPRDEQGRYLKREPQKRAPLRAGDQARGPGSGGGEGR